MLKRKKTSLSIRRIIMDLFRFTMIATLTVVLLLVFRNWNTSVKETTQRLSQHISDGIYEKIDQFVHIPQRMNELNHGFIESGLLSEPNSKQWERFFTDVLSSYESDIYSFTYGTEAGEYYGARRNEQGIIEIVKNNNETGGSSWYYSTNEDGTAGSLVMQTGPFDPRTRVWYQDVVKANAPIMSPVYKHFVMSDLTISAGWPIYNQAGELQGVLASHMLLTDIGHHIQEVVSEFQGFAFIVERESGFLVGNSLGAPNFSVLPDGSIRRYNISSLNEDEISRAYRQYLQQDQPTFIYEGSEDHYYITTKNFVLPGVDWVLLSAIPESLLLEEVSNSTQLALMLAMIFYGLSVVLFDKIMNRLMRPVEDLLQVSASLSSGDLQQRAIVVREDEIGAISQSFNTVADAMQDLITNLETKVEERTQELNSANLQLEDNKNQLRLILDSTAEAIYGIDLQGICTFCNVSSLRMLGYTTEEELIGQNMHDLIHHTRTDGTHMGIEECKIFHSMKTGKGVNVTDEVFWRSDGTSFHVDYHSYPQIRDGKLIGAVITFMDITERREKEKEIEYLSRHDVLTGLQNRLSFEEARYKLDTEENLPLTILFTDVNGLKMTNDVFGHAAGDELIKKAARILKDSCREIDTVARIGGDEFVILLTRTGAENAKKVINRIRLGFANAKVEAIKCSIALGAATKYEMDESIELIMSKAESDMYKDKTNRRQAVNADMILNLIEALHHKGAHEKQHSEQVSQMVGEMGKAIGLAENELAKLKRAAYLHDIGKIVLDDEILMFQSMNEEKMEKMRQHAAVGYRILSLVDDTLDLAEIVYAHHERWDGLGYPKGLIGVQIPRLARMISIAEVYEREFVKEEQNVSLELRRENALQYIEKESGKRFDPELVEVFLKMMRP